MPSVAIANSRAGDCSLTCVNSRVIARCGLAECQFPIVKFTKTEVQRPTVMEIIHAAAGAKQVTTVSMTTESATNTTEHKQRLHM